MIQPSVIAERLVKLRGNMTRDKVANACGISKSAIAIAMYEIGARVPRDEIKIKLAQFYDTTVETIFFTY